MTASVVHALISFAICIAIFINIAFMIRAVWHGEDSFKYSMINAILATLNTGHALIGRDQETWFIYLMAGGWVIVMVTTAMTFIARHKGRDYA